MNDKNSKTIEETGFVEKVDKGQMQNVFRMLFSGDNSLAELFARQVILTIIDIENLNNKIIEKLKRNRISGITFQAITRFENGKIKEFKNWNSFINSDWNIPDVIDTMQLNWTFLIDDPEKPKNYLHTLSVFCSSSIKPQHVMQAMLSMDPTDIESLDIQAVPVSCRINYTDHVISQELMSLVSEWNQGLNNPEYVLNFMKWCQNKSRKIARLVERSIPVLTGIACLAAYSKLTSPYSPELPACTGLVQTTVYWLLATVLILFLAVKFSADIASYIQKNLTRYGKTTVFSITNGDQIRQNELMAKSTRSFYKFVATSVLAILWNILGGVIAAVLMRS